MSQTLFLKDSKYFIRLRDGEYEVSNPEIIMFNFVAPYEWPGDVEVLWRIAASTRHDSQYIACTEQHAKSNPGFHSYAVVKLLPKKEKPESDYKQFEPVGVNDAHSGDVQNVESSIEDIWNRKESFSDAVNRSKERTEEIIRSMGAVESSEPQEKGCKACEIERNDEQVKQMPEHTCKKGSPMDIAQPKSAPRVEYSYKKGYEDATSDLESENKSLRDEVESLKEEIEEERLNNKEEYPD